MKLTAIALLTGAVVAGAAGSATAYQVASSGQPQSEITSVTSPAADTSASTAPQLVRHTSKLHHKRFAPCKHTAHLEHGVCVTEVVHTVVVAPTAPASSEPAGPAPSSHEAEHHGTHHSEGAEPGHDDATPEAGDDHGDHHGDEAGDDNGGGNQPEPGDDNGGDDGGNDDD